MKDRLLKAKTKQAKYPRITLVLRPEAQDQGRQLADLNKRSLSAQIEYLIEQEFARLKFAEGVR